MKEIRRIINNFLFLFIGGVLASLIEFSAEIFLARRLTDVGYGHWAYAQSVFIYLILLADMGLAIYGAREIAHFRDRINSYIANIITIRMLLALTVSLGLLATLWFMDLNKELWMLYFGGILVLFSLAFNPEFVFQGTEKMAGIALWRILNYAFFLIIVLGLIQNRGDLFLVSWVRGGSYLLAAIVLWPIIHKLFGLPRFKNIDRTLWKTILSASVFIALSTIIVNVYFTFDTLVLGKVIGPQQVGWYSAAYKVTGQFMGLAIMVQVVFGPVISRFRDNHVRLERILTAMLLFMLFLGGLTGGSIFLGSSELIKRLFGVDYIYSAEILKGLATVLPVFFLQMVFTSVLLYAGKERLYLLSMGAGGIVNLLLNLIAIPIWGYWGAIITTFTSNILILLMAYYFVSHHFGTFKDMWKKSTWFLPAFVITVLLNFIRNEYASISIFVIVYSLLFLLLFRKDLMSYYYELKIKKEQYDQ